MEISEESLAHLSDEQLVLISLTLDLSQIERINHERFNLLVKDNQNFWQQRFIKDLAQPEKDIIDWKAFYHNYGQLYVTGKWSLYEDEITPVRWPGKAREIKAGKHHSLILDTDNNLWGIGSDGAMLENALWPVLIAKNVTSISASDNLSLYIDVDHNVWLIGGRSHILGHPDRSHIFSGASYVSLSDNHLLIIDLDGKVWGSGWNDRGQLNTELQFVDTVINLNITAYYVYASNRCSLIFTDQEIIVWGDNDIRFPTTNIKSALITNNDAFFIDSEDELWIGDYPMNDIGKVQSISSDLILDSFGYIWSHDLKKIDNRRFRSVVSGEGFSLMISDEYYQRPTLPDGTYIYDQNVVQINFDSMMERLASGEISQVKFERQFQAIPHNPFNQIASLYGANTIYLVELKYNHITKYVYPP